MIDQHTSTCGEPVIVRSFPAHASHRSTARRSGRRASKTRTRERGCCAPGPRPAASNPASPWCRRPAKHSRSRRCGNRRCAHRQRWRQPERRSSLRCLGLVAARSGGVDEHNRQTVSGSVGSGHHQTQRLRRVRRVAAATAPRTQKPSQHPPTIPAEAPPAGTPAHKASARIPRIVGARPSRP